MYFPKPSTFQVPIDCSRSAEQLRFDEKARWVLVGLALVLPTACLSTQLRSGKEEHTAGGNCERRCEEGVDEEVRTSGMVALSNSVARCSCSASGRTRNGPLLETTVALPGVSCAQKFVYCVSAEAPALEAEDLVVVRFSSAGRVSYLPAPLEEPFAPPFMP